jgi:very-short-patch-repair endonuclease
MRRRGPGTTGQYLASCEHGYCALSGRQATSKLEGQIFTLLDYVLGPGKHDWRSQVCGRRVQLDMVFTLPDDRALVVEYDGARWHRGKEERDGGKTRMIEEGWKGRKCVVVRIREDPLMPLELPDVWVPPELTPSLVFKSSFFTSFM